MVKQNENDKNGLRDKYMWRQFIAWSRIFLRKREKQYSELIDPAYDEANQQGEVYIVINVRKLEAELWKAADLLRQGSKLTSQEYCMPVLGLIFLRYAYSRFRMVEADILKDRPMRGGRVLPVEANDFKTKSALFLPEKARYDYLLNLPDNADVGMAVNEAMELIEKQSAQLVGILPKTYTAFKSDLLRELLRIFNNKTLDEIGGDIVGRIYEYFLSKFAPAVASDDGVFFTPKSLVQMIVNILEPTRGTLLDPACGSGGMFVQTGDFVNAHGMNANTSMTFYGQEKVDYNAKLCLMNMAVHGLNGNIKSGDEANTFYADAHNLDGQCDYVMANPPFNVDLVNAENAQNAGRLPMGLPGINKDKVFSNANYLWINYFYSYLNERGRAGFVMAASATDSGNKDRDIREALVRTGHVDVMLSVGNNFFYTKSLPCSSGFLTKGSRSSCWIRCYSLIPATIIPLSIVPLTNGVNGSRKTSMPLSGFIAARLKNIHSFLKNIGLPLWKLSLNSTVI